MGRNRVVAPETVRLRISDGDYLTVKSELNAGEYVDYLTDQAAGHFFARALAYLVGWSLVGANDEPIPYSPTLSLEDRRATLRGLDAATMHEIVEALATHEQKADARIDAKKKTPAGALVS